MRIKWGQIPIFRLSADKKNRYLSLIILLLLALNTISAPAFCEDIRIAPLNIDSTFPNTNPVYKPSEPLTLSDCYKLALKQSEFLAINTDLIKEAEAHFLEALSIIMPHISFLSQDYQEKKLNGGSNDLSLNIPKSSQRQLNLTQTLFNGFKAIAAMKGSKYERYQRIYEKIRADQLLLLDVSNAFYLLIEEREDIRALKKTKYALAYRVWELINREKLGKSRPSEIVYAKAQLYAVIASIEQDKSQEVVARQLLEFLIGRPITEIKDTYKFPIPLMDEDYYIARSYSRPDIEATRYAWQFAKENIKVADSDFLPEVFFQANYYTQRTGFDKGIDWDMTLNASIPIFEGTEVLGRSKEAHFLADENKQLYDRTKRKTPYDIKEAYVRLTGDMKVHDYLRKAYTTAKLNYHLQKRDYNRRLVNNLDVLAAIQTLDDDERSYIHALYEAKRQYWQLRVAVGQNITEDLSDTF